MGWVEVPEQITGTTGRSAKNNNPLNRESRQGSYQDKYAAAPEPTHGGRFAKFPTMEAGYSAGLDQIKLDSGRGHTLSTFVNKFAPPSQNPANELVASYSQQLGVDPNTPLSQIDPQKLMQPMLARESSTKTSYRIAGQGKGRKQAQAQPQGGKWMEVPEENPVSGAAPRNPLNRAWGRWPGRMVPSSARMKGNQGKKPTSGLQGRQARDWGPPDRSPRTPGGERWAAPWEVCRRPWLS